MLYWKYINNYGFICQAQTEVGYYTISSDEDRCGEPLFLEFHKEKEGFCTDKAETIDLGDKTELAEIEQLAFDDYKKRISK